MYNCSFEFPNRKPWVQKVYEKPDSRNPNDSLDLAYTFYMFAAAPKTNPFWIGLFFGLKFDEAIVSSFTS